MIQIWEGETLSKRIASFRIARPKKEILGIVFSLVSNVGEMNLVCIPEFPKVV